ncbi:MULTISPECIES: acetyl-CoA carboxylase biotin carboxyl carrier protein subunit [Candidatus Nitrosocaldus]|jgi:biotin carboxyl carrier protein|uniref:Biotin carboxyl carrier protein of putative acetyl-CoA/ propionyl-CoA carboxylase n=1 Tax=Candidatus Nitrosocaldus cavascurensis TaxID=2058097 RepID=A0A2K5AT10_9ARCH|nr:MULTISPECIES: acetyl-CoA carboxylase biotin carboxyl carrier protein subunit [Candidatus Nitrosocaldus]SPC34771.1 biotin carboxyl carrier protein of putative acetyl-CoA/ propionyl-CoA carboxylase [Candidatus Nitrosocaldus cavascurensis]
MRFRIEDIAHDVNAEVKDASRQGILATINGRECRIDLISINKDRVEFLLNGRYHTVRYTDSSSSKELKMVLDDMNEVSVNLVPDARLTKDAGGAGDRSKYLTSSVPGKIISILAKKDMPVKKGDVIMVVESMKMQVKIKAHKDGVVKELKVKEGANIARNDIIAIIE